MHLNKLIKNIREPPRESMIGHMVGEHGTTLRHMPFVILFNLAWLFLYPVLAHASFWSVIFPTLLTVPVFVYLHLCTYYVEGPAKVRLKYVGAMFALGFLVVFFNVSGVGYIIFAYFSLAFCLPTRVVAKIIAGVVVLFVLQMILLGHNTGTILGCALPAALLGVSAIYTAQTTHQQAHLRRSNLEITRLATLAERERIGRDLHDLLGHTLSVVALKSELARKLIDRDLDAARAEIAEVERVARDSLTQVRNAVSGIRNTALSAELAAATALLEAQGLQVKCETENVKLPHDRETALALSLREAATNIRRHSGASGVTIRVRKEPTEVVVEVVDDGRGGRIVPGNGLNGMRERLGSVGGSLSLTPNKDGGTLLRASVPIAA